MISIQILTFFSMAGVQHYQSINQSMSKDIIKLVHDEYINITSIHILLHQQKQRQKLLFIIYSCFLKLKK